MAKKKEPEIVELPKFVCDDLHFGAQEIDGYNKDYNLVVCEREAGKSTLMWKKIYNAFKKDGCPSIVIKRLICDITEQYIEDTINLLEKFTGMRLPLQYCKQDIKQGQMDVRLNGKIFVRLIGLSAPLSRLKSMMIPNVRYMMTDEFICNMRIGEKYLTDEPMRFKELYTTYNRESWKHDEGLNIKAYWFGNPYSLYNPYFSWLNVPTNQLWPGAMVIGSNYAVHCYQIKPELKEYIMAHNPLYQFDEGYKKYAFDGRAVQDENIRIMETQPLYFSLAYCFKLNDKILGVFRGYHKEEDLFYWVKMMDEKDISKRRDIVCYDFGQLANRCVLGERGKKNYQSLKACIRNRQISYQTVEASWMMEEIYQCM